MVGLSKYGFHLQYGYRNAGLRRLKIMNRYSETFDTKIRHFLTIGWQKSIEITGSKCRSLASFSCWSTGWLYPKFLTILLSFWIFFPSWKRGNWHQGWRQQFLDTENREIHQVSLVPWSYLSDIHKQPPKLQ